MSVGQMLAHCAEAQEVANGTKKLEGAPFVAKLFKGFIRKTVVNEKPYPKGTKTHPQYLQSTERDFQREKEYLLSALKMFVKMDEAKVARVEHLLFGRMTREERGWGMYKHLDHHLKQFGV